MKTWWAPCFAFSLGGILFEAGFVPGVLQAQTLHTEESSPWAQETTQAQAMDAQAQLSMEKWYYGIERVPSSATNARQAAEWYRKAAEQGYAEAQYQLGIMYYKGRGVPQDYREAYAWVGLAAAQGYRNANSALAQIAEKLDADTLAQAKELSKKYYEHYVEPFR